jgi:CheY-like chemotaxis protein
MTRSDGRESILWMDDKVETSYVILVEALQAAGYEVKTATDVPEAKRWLASTHQFDVVIVDLRLPSPHSDGFAADESSGLDLIEYLEGRFAMGESSVKHPRVIVCSAHLDQENYRKLLRSKNWPVFILDKGDINRREIESPSDEFVRLVTEALETPTWDAAGRHIAGLEEWILAKGPLGMTLSDFEQLTGAQKSLVYDQGFEYLRAVLNRNHRSHGIRWALFCGSKKPRRQGATDDQLPSEAEISKVAENFDRIPFLLSLDDTMDVEESSRGAACEGALWDYPRFDVRLGAAKSSRSAHFDTGAEMHFFNKHDLIDAEVPLHGTWRGQIRDGLIYKMLELPPINGTILVDGMHNETIDVEFQGAYAIDPWANCRWARKCTNPAACRPVSVDSKGRGLCFERHALVGRRFLQDNWLEVTIKGGSSSMEITRQKED